LLELSGAHKINFLRPTSVCNERVNSNGLPASYFKSYRFNLTEAKSPTQIKAGGCHPFDTR
jgi:hypothetical protein